MWGAAASMQRIELHRVILGARHLEDLSMHALSEVPPFIYNDPVRKTDTCENRLNPDRSVQFRLQ